MSDMQPLMGRASLVTGAAAGIGRAVALALAQAGADVAVHYYGNQSGADAVVGQIERLGRRGTAVQADLRLVEEASRMVGDVIEWLGRDLDTVVNNTGGLVRRCPVETMDEALWRDVIDLNLTSAFGVSRAAIPSLKRAETGRIVNISSMAAFNGGGGGDGGIVPYAVAKAGLENLTKGLARELAPFGVTVNAVAPGIIGQTSLHDSFTATETRDAIVRGVPLGREGTPHEVAVAVLFLASPDTGFITGETIVVDGGVRIR